MLATPENDALKCVTKNNVDFLLCSCEMISSEISMMVGRNYYLVQTDIPPEVLRFQLQKIA